MNQYKSFNSLQTGKPIQSGPLLRIRSSRRCFNSLQTGKPIQRMYWISSWTTPMLGFNSLQTGKPIQRNNGERAEQSARLFQFPSNGKAYPKNYCEKAGIDREQVSIPFKRESLSKANTMVDTMNGGEVYVSIPFKRESLSKEQKKPRQMPKRKKVSIPFKRESLSKVINRINNNEASIMFQFPSNGKAYPKNFKFNF